MTGVRFGGAIRASIRKGAAVALVSTLLAAMSGPGTAATTPRPEDREKWLAAQEIFLRENYWRMDWKKTADGLQYLPVKRVPDSKAQPTWDSIVTVNYDGRLINGRLFDSTYIRKKPATFALNDVIKGWQEALPMMRVGEIWQFAVPAALAYGNEKQRLIPPGSVLVFKIELLAVERPR
jgi:FKBP-type peptidyl-prolyl cis-trans isomerase FkpA